MASVHTAVDTDTSTPARTPAVKDRECPYCHEFFTSSSLGRHLDQFIKEDKPKPPDGKHNVDEIQRIRGGVTRRQARNSSSRRDGQRHGSTPNEPTPPAAKKLRLNGSGGHVALNRPNWLTTGVIPDVDSNTPTAMPSLEGSSQVNFDREQRQFINERNEGRAAKLALTELLDSIKASLAISSLSSPFAFDFLSQSFPSLVLNLLPSQPTINSHEVIPSPTSWPIDPPGDAHMNMLRDIVSKKVDNFRREAVNRRRRHVSEDSRADSPSSSSEKSATGHNLDAYPVHLEAAYEKYISLSSAERTRSWHLAALRAFTQEREAHNETRKRLETTEQLLANETAQVKRLSSIQQPREYLIHPPATTPLPPKTAQSVAYQLMGDETERLALLNADVLIEKWKPRVQSNRGFQRSFMSIFEAAAAIVAAAEAEAVPQPTVAIGNGTLDGDPPSYPVHNNQRRNGNPVANDSLSLSRDITKTGNPLPVADADLMADDGDSVDASGEDDDEVPVVAAKSGNQGTSYIETRPELESGVLDPSLRGAKAGSRDQGEFGAESLMAKVGNAVGGSSTPGNLRKRARR